MNQTHNLKAAANGEQAAFEKSGLHPTSPRPGAVGVRR